MIRVRGPDKVACHVMFGLLALSAIQITRLVQWPSKAPRPAFRNSRKSRENKTALPNSSHLRTKQPPPTKNFATASYCPQLTPT
jgi:hypothetical protein